MRIAIDATTLCDPSGMPGAGIEHYTWSVLLSLLKISEDDQFTVIVPASIDTRRITLLQASQNVRILKLKKSKIPFVARHILLPLRLALRRIDVLFSPFGQIPLGWNGRSVITIHDAAIFEHPEWFPDSSADNLSTRKVVPRSIKNSGKIIAVSSATKDQLQRVFPESVGKISVIHEAVSPPDPIPTLSSRFQSMLLHVEDLLLFVGTVEPRKNLLNALHAFHRFLEIHPQRAPITRFMIAGKLGWKTEEIEAAIKDVNSVWQKKSGGNVVQYAGYVSESEKWSLIKKASALLLVSHDEGFGLPLLEAMSVGTPAIVSEIPALKEVGGDAVFYVKPEDPETIALTIAQALLVPEGLGDLREAAIKRAAEFDWEQAAQETLKILHEALKPSKASTGGKAPK